MTVKSESRPVKSESFATTAVEPKPLATPEPQGNSSVIAQSVIMGGALKDAVGASVAIRSVMEHASSRLAPKKPDVMLESHKMSLCRPSKLTCKYSS